MVGYWRKEGVAMLYCRYLEEELIIEKYSVNVTKRKMNYDEEEYYIYGVKIPEQFLPIFQGKRIVLTKGFGRKNHSLIINAFLEPEWEELEERLNALPVSSDKAARRIAYFFQGSAQDSELTDGGSIVVMEYLINMADIIDDQCLFLVIHQEDGTRFAIARKDLFED